MEEVVVQIPGAEPAPVVRKPHCIVRKRLPHRPTRQEWYEKVSTAEEEVAAKGAHGHDWWSTPWFKVPTIRHTWGEAQAEMHAGSQELVSIIQAEALKPLERCLQICTHCERPLYRVDSF